MYKENEVLVLTEDLGSKEKGNLIPKGTMATFIKAVDDSDIRKCLIAIKIEDKVVVTLETNIKIKSWWRRRQAFRNFNNQFMISSPRLRRYHPNPILKIYYRVMYFFKDLGGKDV